MNEEDTFNALKKIPYKLFTKEINRQPREWWGSPVEEFREWFRVRGWTVPEYINFRGSEDG